jgi:succinyl-CoA synthetase alpha subunit/citrate synthase
MRQLTTKPFPYYVGVYSLEELVTRESRVCVINILGNESRKVTPVSHTYSGGNVVAGIQYGRRGELETPIGNIPVYRSARDAMKEGIRFDIGVIYLPPLAVTQAVWELVTYNKELKRIVIVTEKVPTRDSHNVRMICQEAGVDVIGANCLGVANAWDHVRVGGALGGDNPEETLKRGSVAIHSNSGNFTTTIAEYLRTAGFGISTAISSGKDVYIHFAVAEFLYAAQNDPRTKAVVLYVEPGGYYEKQALDWINDRRFSFNKPLVVCVTGRWKKDLVRPCGHAGAMSGSGDDAETKERWFDDYFETPVFNPEKPDVSKKGVRVSSIQHIPAAMTEVYKKLDESPDFETSGDLSLKLWISDNTLPLPVHLSLPITKALEPYDRQITEISKQVGANILRQNMRNKSGVSLLDPKTQVAALNGRSVLELAGLTFEENLYFSIAKVMPGKRDTRRMNMLLNVLMSRVDQTSILRAAEARKNGCLPNAALASEIARLCDSVFLSTIRAFSREIIDLIREYDFSGKTEDFPDDLDAVISERFLTSERVPIDEITNILLKEVRETLRTRPALKLCQRIIQITEEKHLQIRDGLEFFIAAINVCMFWNPMLEKRISRQTVEDAVTYLNVVANMAAFSSIHPSDKQESRAVTATGLATSFTVNLFKCLFGRKPEDTELIELQYLLGLTVTNGPGTLSAKGAKESVSARNPISVAFVGFLCNTGLAHGGNGFEAVEFLLDQFRNSPLDNPGSKDPKLDLAHIAGETARTYAKYKQMEKESGSSTYRRIPCVNHPVFKGNSVNIDPREDFIRKELEKYGIVNLFLDYYHALVKELFNEGVTPNVFCVNVDAVLAVIALKLIWRDLKSGRWTAKQVQDLVFTLFLLGRAIGTVAEIADHRDRGLDMDCRTPQEELTFVL